MEDDLHQQGTYQYLDAVLLNAHQAQQEGEHAQSLSQEETILRLFADKDALLAEKDAVIAAFQIASRRAVFEYILPSFVLFTKVQN